jgi:TRAP-type C4-dicarboxylate transport system permease small subunit
LSGQVFARLIARLRTAALDIAALMLGGLFVVFLVQIGSRYLLNAPALWTLEACLTLWLWLVFWGGAFILGERDHVRFDVLYAAARQRTRRLFALASALAISGGFLAALPATWSYISFYEIKRSSVLGIRLDVVFSIYAVFAVMMVLRYGLRAVLLARGADPVALDQRQKQDGYSVQ